MKTGGSGLGKCAVIGASDTGLGQTRTGPLPVTSTGSEAGSAKANGFCLGTADCIVAHRAWHAIDSAIWSSASSCCVAGAVPAETAVC